jgi:hypothetical protein
MAQFTLESGLVMRKMGMEHKSGSMGPTTRESSEMVLRMDEESLFITMATSMMAIGLKIRPKVQGFTSTPTELGTTVNGSMTNNMDLARRLGLMALSI